MASAGFLLVTLLAARHLGAQQPTQSPHGPLEAPCTLCHSPDGWSPVHIDPAFDHAKYGYALDGAHRATTCQACHNNLQFSGTPTQCLACHEDVHRGELGPACDRCHSLRGFTDRNLMLRLHQTTRFPLVGAHLAVDCEGCHTPRGQGGMQFVGRSVQCADCHQEALKQARTSADPAIPDHQAPAFAAGCDQCHRATIWQQATFDHGVVGFPLTGAHRALSCDQCHKGGQVLADCVSCHQSDYDTAIPNHRQANFPTDCAQCHGTRAWNTPYDHSRTRFPLTGAHRALSCDQCHGDGVFAGKLTSCVSCHGPGGIDDRYSTTTAPAHASAGFTADCSGCHNTTDFLTTTWSHPTSPFRLTGAHTAIALDCTRCHISGYGSTRSTCESCHGPGALDDQWTATNPSHAALGWPQTCTTCHSGSASATDWSQGVTLPQQYHTQFDPNHQGARGVCSQCHNSTNYSLSTCSNHHHSASCTVTNQRACGD